MPRIIADKKQKEALATTEAALEDIRLIDTILLGHSKDTPVLISVRTEKRGLIVAPKLAAHIIPALIKHRAAIVKEILSLTSKYMIELSEDELDLISNRVPVDKDGGQANTPEEKKE